jgi:hypothetical protein
MRENTGLRLPARKPFGDILRNRLDHGKKKGGIKVHAMMDAFSGIVEFVRMTEAKLHDRNFLYNLNLLPDSWLVFDKAYNVYRQFAKWSSQKVWFVTRMKDNADYHVIKVLTDKSKKKSVYWQLKIILFVKLSNDLLKIGLDFTRTIMIVNIQT